MFGLQQVLANDGLTFNKIAKYCEIDYRMNFNPLPNIRKYLAVNGFDIPLHYIETGYKLHREDILNRVCGRAVPLILVIATKKEGYCVRVDMCVLTLDACKVDPDGIINYV